MTSEEANRVRVQAYRARHKAAGLCQRCSEPALEGRGYCEPHLVENRARARNNYKFWSSHHLENKSRELKKEADEMTGVQDQVWACAQCCTQRKYGDGKPEDKWIPKQLNCSTCARPTEHWFSHVGVVGLSSRNGDSQSVVVSK